MKNILKKKFKDEKGFTLVQVLVVFVLLALLAAIIIPNVSDILTDGSDRAAAGERSIIQTAMDSMMAMYRFTTVTPVVVATSHMSNFPVDHPLYPEFLRHEATKGTYTCDATGKVTLVSAGD
jgi:type II secretory pathway pseudopilin PulG